VLQPVVVNKAAEPANGAKAKAAPERVRKLRRFIYLISFKV
jgi:hypothetical protein